MADEAGESPRYQKRVSASHQTATVTSHCDCAVFNHAAKSRAAIRGYIRLVGKATPVKDKMSFDDSNTESHDPYQTKARMSFEEDGARELDYGAGGDYEEPKQEVLQESELEHFDNQESVDIESEEVQEEESFPEAPVEEEAVVEIVEELAADPMEDPVEEVVEEVQEEAPEAEDAQGEESATEADQDLVEQQPEEVEEAPAYDDREEVAVEPEEEETENTTPVEDKKDFPTEAQLEMRRMTIDNGEKDIKRGTVKGLISLFSNPDELAKNTGPVNKTYKTEYGAGAGVGKLSTKAN